MLSLPPPIACAADLGLSTGALPDRSLPWPDLVAASWRTAPAAVELTALSSSEWAGLFEYLQASQRLPFAFISVHGPTKGAAIAERRLVNQYRQLPAWVNTIVIHPDVLGDARLYRSVGRRIAVENMDPRKGSGRTAEELAPLFNVLSQARFCLDVAHASAVDPSMAQAHVLLDTFRDRLSHIHISSLGTDDRHERLTEKDAVRFASVLERCADVPWIFEA